MTRLQLIDLSIKLVTAFGIGVWLYFIATIATTPWPMIRQLLGCMVTTMLIFGLLSVLTGALRRLKEQEETPRED